MRRRGKPTRRDLLIVIGRLQNLAGSIGSAAQDRSPERAAQLNAIEKRMMDICIDARGYDPIIDDDGPWADADGEDQNWKAAR